jgi:8-oxo-dGTP diphosphatase
MRDVGAVATIYDDRGRVLLVHQTYKGSKWSWPGGHVERGEAPWQTVVREVKEETGLAVRVLRLVSVYYIVDRDSLGFQFLCRVVGGEIHVDGVEISEAAFFAHDHLPSPMTRPGRQRVADARAAGEQPIMRVYARVELDEGDRVD